MNYFPNTEEEKDLIKFISKYQYLHVNDEKYFFTSKKYFKNRINNLIDKRFLKRYKQNYIVLDELGIEYAQLLGYEYNKLNRNKKYQERLAYISNLAAFYHKCNTLTFIPSFSIKDKETYTMTSRRYIGIININGIEYLTYYISAEHDYKYISSIIYDIQKEKNYKNIIILTDNISRIKIENFIFGMNQVLIIKDTKDNREKLKYLYRINYPKIVQDKYNNVYLSKYNFCDYTDYKNKYISLFYFLDTEKINKIKYFLRENKNQNMDIICGNDIKEQLNNKLSNCNYNVIQLEDYIDKEYNVYE